MALIFAGVLVDLLGAAFFPTGSTTACTNGACETALSPVANYAVEVVGIAMLVLGVVLVYLAARPNFRTMFP